jgi:phosphoserine phosphatase RsbU/P
MIKTDFLLANLPEIFLGFLLIIIGLGTALVFLLKRKSSELHLLYLAIFILGYGLRVIASNDLVVTEVNVPLAAWEYIVAVVTDLLPVLFILFLESFIGWGWKRSVWWLLLVWLFYGFTAITIDIVTGDPGLVGGTIINNILVLLIIVVISLNRFLTPQKSSREGGIIGLGFLVFILGVLFNNLVSAFSFLDGSTVEQTTFLFFVCCMIYAAIRRSSSTEREYLAIIHDLETARQIQLSILPQHLPQSASFSVFTTYIPTTMIGGDFYAYHQDDDWHIGILVADISGHGIPAALLASMVKVAFNSQESLASRPAELLESMNRTLTGQMNNEFITMAYLWFDFREMTLHQASAGHPAPVLIRGSQPREIPAGGKGIPVGISGDVNYGESSADLQEGDRILVYTDGLIEVFSPPGEIFGKNRLLSALAGTGNLTGEEVSTHLIRNVNAWSGMKKDKSLDDDVTLIGLDVKRTEPTGIQVP